VVERSAALVIGKEENRILPGPVARIARGGRGGHQRIDQICNLLLSGKDRLARARMLVADAVGRLNEDKAGETIPGLTRRASRSACYILKVLAAGILADGNNA